MKDGSTQAVRIASLDAERGKVKLDNGETVALNELQGLDADTKDVIEKLDRFDMGDTWALAFHSYLLAEKKGEATDGVRFVMEYALAYDQGRNGVISLEEATKRSSLPADIVKEAYDQGALQTETWRKDQERQNAEKRAKAKDGATGRKGILDKSRVSQEKLDALSADKKDALRTLELIAEATGVDIQLIAQKSNKKGNVRGYQGKYSKDGNYIEIDINAGLNNIFKDLHTGMTAVLGHELTHWIQENAPTEYLAYKKAVLQAIMSTKNGELTLERMVEAQISQNKREGKEITRSEAENEVVADASMKRLGDSEFWDAVADNLGDKKADVFAKIKEYISQFFNRVREIIGRASQTSEAAKLIDRVEANVQATLRRLYAEGIGAAMRNSAQTGTETKNAATEGGGVQYSIRQTSNGQLYVQADRQVLTGDDPVQWGKQIEDYINKVIRNGEDFVVPTRDGSHFLALTSRSAYKLSDRHVQERRHDGVKRLLSDAQYHRKGVAATHIDELIQVATFKGYDEDFDGWHENDIGEDGFNYFNAFFRDFDGSYYKVFFSSALNEEEETAFSIGNIERRRFPDRNGSSSQGEALQSGGKPSTKNDSTNGVESQAPKTALAAALEKAQAEKEAKRSTRDYNSTVILEESTIDKYLRDYAAKTSPNYAQAYIVRMSPNEFLNLTTSKTGRDTIWKQTGELDVDKLKKATIDQPFQLNIDTKNGQVEGHEGRHRAMALYNNGVNSIPVLLFDSSNKYDKTALASLELKGQDFGKSRSDATVTVQDVQPLSYANRDNVVQKFTTQPTTERMGEKYGGKETIRYSTRPDTDYLDAVERGDLETAQKMVDEAAKKAGYDIKAYHGTNSDFTVFDPDRIGANYHSSYGGFYFRSTNDVNYYGNNTIYAYLKMENPMVLQASDDFYNAEDYYDVSPLDRYYAAKSNKNDGIIVKHKKGNLYVVFNSEQIKSAAPVTYDDSGKVIPLSERFNPEQEDIRYSTRDYSDTSDLDLLLNAANEISEGGGEDYWTSLLESNPGLANEAEEIKRLGKQLKKTEGELAEARRNLTLTDRKLKTRGIASLAATIMQDQKAGDINKKDVKNRITDVLTEAYQKALDQLDEGADIGTAWETVYSEGVVKAADILLSDATYAEKHGYGWVKTSLSKYLGEGGREYVEADIAARVAQDFETNRYRPGQKATTADRLVADNANPESIIEALKSVPMLWD